MNVEIDERELDLLVNAMGVYVRAGSTMTEINERRRLRTRLTLFAGCCSTPPVAGDTDERTADDDDAEA